MRRGRERRLTTGVPCFCWLLPLFEDVMCTASLPDDVRLTGADRCAIAEKGAVVRRPDHLEHARLSLHTFHPEAEAKPPADILNEVS